MKYKWAQTCCIIFNIFGKQRNSSEINMEIPFLPQLEWLLLRNQAGETGRTHRGTLLVESNLEQPGWNSAWRFLTKVAAWCTEQVPGWAPRQYRETRSWKPKTKSGSMHHTRSSQRHLSWVHTWRTQHQRTTEVLACLFTTVLLTKDHVHNG